MQVKRVQKRVLISGILAVLLVGWGSMAQLSLSPAHAQNSSEIMTHQSESNILTVSGMGLVNVETSIAVIRLGVLVDGESAAGVQEEVANRSTQLIERLQSESVNKLQTTGIRLNPRYQYDRDGNAQQTGVQGQNSVQFEVPIDQAGAILDGAIESGATQIESVTFKAEDSVLEEARQAAIRLAIQDARTQADTVLDALELSSDGIARITVNGSHQAPAPMIMQAEAYSSMSRDSNTPVLGGEQTVSASISLQVRYLN